MGIASARHVCMALFAILAPYKFASPAYEGLREALPFAAGSHAIIAWGWVFAATGILCALGAIRASEDTARWALFISVVVTAAIGGGFLAAWAAGVLTGPTAMITLFAVALKDLTMLRSPLRNPFEPVVQRVLSTSPPA